MMMETNQAENGIIGVVNQWLAAQGHPGGRWFVEICRGIRDLVLALIEPLHCALDLTLLQAVAAQHEWAVTRLSARALLVEKDGFILQEYDSQTSTRSNR